MPILEYWYSKKDDIWYVADKATGTIVVKTSDGMLIGGLFEPNVIEHNIEKTDWGK